MNLHFGKFLCLLLVSVSQINLQAQLNVLTSQEKKDGWELLFNGKDLTGFKQLNGEAKVAELGVALLVDEDVLGLEVAVHDVVGVQVVKREHNAADVEARQVLLHALQHLHLQPRKGKSSDVK